MKEVNLEEILKSISIVKLTFAGSEVFTKGDCLKAMRDACNQAIDLAAENADYKLDGLELEEGISIDKESMLKTKNKIK